jgi:hypothetical protein
VKELSKTKLAFLFLAIPLVGCASMKSWFGVNDENRVKPISNPFYSYHAGGKTDANQTMILRTKKGDRSVEIEMPGDTQRLSDFVLPVSPAFKDTNGRQPASISGRESQEGEFNPIDESYKTRAASMSDHEITRSFSQGTIQDQGRQRDIEQSLNLIPNEDDNSSEGSLSYLAAVDHIKQLYKAMRYEAALLAIDDMIRLYQTDPKLYEMRGTLLERLGRRELALKSWTQALKLEPHNESLRRFIDRKQFRSAAGAP